LITFVTDLLHIYMVLRLVRPTNEYHFVIPFSSTICYETTFHNFEIPNQIAKSIYHLIVNKEVHMAKSSTWLYILISNTTFLEIRYEHLWYIRTLLALTFYFVNSHLELGLLSTLDCALWPLGTLVHIHS
jgi:hypothetical protein